MPHRFQLVPRYERESVRRRIADNYLIFYRVGDGSVEILHILHGARDYEQILFPEY
jgi:plasmid stabilization system protein ParE